MICVAFFSKFCHISILYLLHLLTCSYFFTCSYLLPILLARYIRSFDVISEVNCVLLRRTRSFKIIALYQNFDDITEVIAFCQEGGKFLISL